MNQPSADGLLEVLCGGEGERGKEGALALLEITLLSADLERDGACSGCWWR